MKRARDIKAAGAWNIARPFIIARFIEEKGGLGLS
jgi:hypothetical protein